MHRPLDSSPNCPRIDASSPLLPITICVVVGVAALLGAMGDVAGGVMLHRLALGCGILWVIELICLRGGSGDWYAPRPR